ALSTDIWDAEDLGSGPHAGTFASEQKDGHGRTIVTTEQVHAGGGIETHDTRVTYLAGGELTSIRRVRGADAVVRSVQYDSLGRMVLNIEPNTAKTTDTGAVKAWRYAYSDNGDVVGTSDARGCGMN